jgi:zinc protease
MIKFLASALCLFLILAAPVMLHGSKIFPYDYKIEVLENGLKIVSIPLPNPYIISYYTIVRSGSRNEVEPGKSGFAHFFEHMMFKGTETMSPEEYDNFLSEIGAGNNAFTSDDYTCYYVVFAGRENLESVIKAEADRFINLYFNEEMLKTEATVIEGEYYASVSSPYRRLYELLRDTAYEAHSYKHTTLGYLQDIQDMPNQFEYSQLYKKRFYAPDNSILLVAGDFDHYKLMTLVKQYYSGWEKSDYTLVTPKEPPQTKPKKAHYDWPAKTMPLLAIGYHGPAYSDEKIDKPALDLMAEYAFSSSSDIYQKLVIEEQVCQSLSASFSDHRDPYLLVFNAVVKDEKDLPYVEEQIRGELERMKKEPVSEQRLADIKSNLKYSFADSLATTDDIASVLAFYINLTADPGTVNKLFDLYDRVTPQDIMEMTQKYFVPSNSTVATLTGGGTR